MKQYIDKAALVAEIESLRRTTFTNFDEGVNATVQTLLEIINTLETKEVKEPTASDKGMAEEIIINLRRVEQDYHINLTREMEWVRNKAQKGE